MSKLPKDKRDKIILVSMGTLVACAAIWFFVIKAQSKSLDDVRKEVAKSREQVDRGQTTMKAQAKMEEEFAAATQALKQREAGMAAPNDMYSWFIEKLLAFQAGSKVEIPEFPRPMPADVGCFAKFPYHAATFSVRGTAHYHDFGKFLADFENSFPYMRVQNIDLEPAVAEASGKTETREKLGFRMELLTLVRPVAP